MAKKKKYQWNTEASHNEDDQWQSRSQKKRDSTALQALGDELVAMPMRQVKTLPLTPELLEALTLMARISDREGRRRQSQYIGKLMRECDAAAVREALQKLQQGHTKDTALFHRAERLRTALLEGNATEQARVVASLSSDEEGAAALRDLVQTAQDSVAAKRELFRLVRERLQQKEQTS